MMRCHLINNDFNRGAKQLTQSEAAKELSDKIALRKQLAFDYSLTILKMNSNDLMISGYRNLTKEQAVVKMLQDTEQTIKQLINKYLTQFPD